MKDSELYNDPLLKGLEFIGNKVFEGLLSVSAAIVVYGVLQLLSTRL